MSLCKSLIVSKLILGLIALSAQGQLLLPPPPIEVDSVNNPSPGYIFLATWDRHVPAVYGNFIFVLDEKGNIVDSVRVKGAPYDFQVQPNGQLSYALGDFSSEVPLPGEDLRHVVLDQQLQVVDSFKMKNGYGTDFHEFLILPNGHVMMMSYHTIPYDMSGIVEGGQTDASLVINIIQEQDADKNVVFEWRNIDYIPITDSDLDLTESRLNYSTLNGFDLDRDGNILASFRNHSEIMKISRQSGEILWRMGSPRGDFVFEGEHEENTPYYFARQHHVRRLPNGNISLFDNGAFHEPPSSRALEYALDEEQKVARLVSEWSYPHGNIFSVTAGNAERLPDGGWFIGYGVAHANYVKRNAVEVHPDGSLALELSLPEGVLAYRATKMPWKETADYRSFTNYGVREGNTYFYADELIHTGIRVQYLSLESADYNESKIIRVPYGPVQPRFIETLITVSPVSVIYEGLAIYSQHAELHVGLAEYPEITDPENTIIYYRKHEGQGLFAPLETRFDEVNNELIAVLDGFGELVFGVPDHHAISHAPILYAPTEGDVLAQDTIALKWTGKGMYSSFFVQLSLDSTFSTVLEEKNTRLSSWSLAGLERDTSYYWRVNARLGSYTSPWSPVRKFSLENQPAALPGSGNREVEGYSLGRNFPNPVEHTTRIAYSLKQEDFITLKIYDQAGREIQTLVHGKMNRGSYFVDFNAGGLPGGIYFYRMETDRGFTGTRKMVLMGKSK